MNILWIEKFVSTYFYLYQFKLSAEAKLQNLKYFSSYFLHKSLFFFRSFGRNIKPGGVECLGGASSVSGDLVAAAPVNAPPSAAWPAPTLRTGSAPAACPGTAAGQLSAGVQISAGHRLFGQLSPDDRTVTT